MPEHSTPGTLFQIGYVVPNLDAALAHLNGKLGAARFMALREIVVENGWFRGSNAPINHSMAFGYVGDMQFEIIEPVSGKSTYSEFLERVPEGGVHHLGYSVEDYDAATADLLARGYRAVQRGTFGDTKFGYFETSDDPGTVTEIVYLDPNVRGMFANIKAQTF
jgi:methylmalonyl-CoA/ethylmalonyl-CoA epimerase